MYFKSNILLYAIFFFNCFIQSQVEINPSEIQYNKIICKINQIRTEGDYPTYPLGTIDIIDNFIKSSIPKWETSQKRLKRNYLNLIKKHLTKADIPYFKMAEVITETIDLNFTTSQLFQPNTKVYSHLLDSSYTIATGGFIPLGNKYLFVLILLETDIPVAALPTCPSYYTPIPLKFKQKVNPRYAHFRPFKPLTLFSHRNATHFATFVPVTKSQRVHPFTRIASINLNPTLNQFIYPIRLDSDPLDFTKLVCMINYLRQTSLHKANPVAADITLMSVARNHSEYLAKTGPLTNYGPNSHSVGERLLAQKYPWLAYGQNIARGYKKELHVIDALMQSTHHRDIILNPTYNHVGAWKVPKGNYWTILFATISKSSHSPPQRCDKFNLKRLDQYQ